MCCIPTWEWTLLVVRQSQLGATSMRFAERAYSYKLVAATVDALCELEN